jgi:hypothetical protein
MGSNRTFDFGESNLRIWRQKIISIMMIKMKKTMATLLR